ncbi:membrane protein [Marinobacterium nitratireducens]|uniref:Murein endopeptidase K n=1 Tax=Marinobacterium nitratireducens TaxID=518897 RepID=A0A917ZD52_9GAMM|nr:YcbK family protein [Marinobacterium nitratireducens]GGO80626.1 membrane protein [Marinobacterium nitratireducens]
MPQRIIQNRRTFLKTLAGTAMGLAGTSAIGAPLVKNPALERKLTLNNLHTGEKLTAVYWAGGDYQLEALKEIDHVLRDHRSGTSIEMDRQLFDLLYMLQRDIGLHKEFQIISGYRSPETNAKLRQQSSGVAKKSYHMLGKALDIRVPGVPLRDLQHKALSLKSGGVGYYAKSNFIHVDVGPVRRWG